MTSLFQVPAGSGHHPYVQGPYLQPGPTIPKSPYSVPVVPSPAQFHESGICEVILVIFVFLLWLYSFYRLYLVWQKTLNFSESSIQGPQGWDLLVTWIAERIRIRNLKVSFQATLISNFELGRLYGKKGDIMEYFASDFARKSL